MQKGLLSLLLVATSSQAQVLTDVTTAFMWQDVAENRGVILTWNLNSRTIIPMKEVPPPASQTVSAASWSLLQ